MNLCGETFLETTFFFFREGSRKKERDPILKYIFFNRGTGQNVSFSTLSSLFFLSSLCFFVGVSLSKKQHPERERAERENELLPSSYFPHHHLGAVFEKVITEKTTTSEDVIYILTHTHV